MRPLYYVLAAALAASACSSSSESNVVPTPTTPSGGPISPNGLTVVVDSGFSDRTAVVATTVPARVHVTLNGRPAPNVTVAWAVAAGGGSVSPSATITDANGAASVTWTIGDTVRINTLSASSSGSSASMQVQSLPDAAVSLAKASPDSSAVVAGASVMLTVLVVDKFGNSVAGTPVSWTTSDGTLTITDTPTGPSGRAQVVLSTAATPAAYTVTATSGALGSASFKVV
ncbi:MAG TPA: Ig-like domain-containing protein, partial [Gemmatimonadaceae bacterium]